MCADGISISPDWPYQLSVVLGVSTASAISGKDSSRNATATAPFRPFGISMCPPPLAAAKVSEGCPPHRSILDLSHFLRRTAKALRRKMLKALIVRVYLTKGNVNQLLLAMTCQAESGLNRALPESNEVPFISQIAGVPSPFCQMI